MLERALKRADQSPFIHHQLALCYKRKKVAEQSCKPFSNQSTHRRTACLKVLLSFNKPNSKLNMLFCSIGEVRHWRRICIRHLEEAVKIKPSFILALTDLALLYAEERDLRRYSSVQSCSDSSSFFLMLWIHHHLFSSGLRRFSCSAWSWQNQKKAFFRMSISATLTFITLTKKMRLKLSPTTLRYVSGSPKHFFSHQLMGKHQLMPLY